MILQSIAIPTHDELVTELLARRLNLVGTEHVWLCCTDDHGWYVTNDRRRLLGLFARGTIGRGDSNGAVEMLARDLLGGIAKSRRSVLELEGA